MKNLFILILPLVALHSGRADMLLITSTNSASQITVASNQVLIISAVRPSTLQVDASPYIPTEVDGATFATNGIQYPFVLPCNNQRPLAWAGPVTISFPTTNNPGAINHGPYLISYQLIQSTNIQTIIIPQTNSSPGQFAFQIPAGRNAHFFSPLSLVIHGGSFVGGTVTVSNATQYIQAVITGGEEIPGPATVTVGQSLLPYFPFCEVYSYYLTDSFVAAPEAGYIQGGTGKFQIAIESSQDLTNWTQVITYPTSSSQKGFYRMKVSQ